MPAAARQALLQQVNQQPSNAAVLWLACACFVAYNSLPDQAVHTLGFGQQAAVLNWQQVPPASCHVRVRGLLAAAAGPGLGCLDLKSRPQVHQFYRERLCKCVVVVSKDAPSTKASLTCIVLQ